MNLSSFLILQSTWGGKSVLVLSFVLLLDLRILGQLVTFCILLVGLEPIGMSLRFIL